jgi:hypothetical protein
LKAKKDDPALSQMKRSQASTELSLLQFDEDGYALKLSKFEKVVTKALEARNTAKQIYDIELEAFDKNAFAECEAQLLG